MGNNVEMAGLAPTVGPGLDAAAGFLVWVLPAKEGWVVRFNINKTLFPCTLVSKFVDSYIFTTTLTLSLVSAMYMLLAGPRLTG